jgi:hypothetical protein
MSLSLDQPLSLADLTKAVSSMASSKSPGPDGVITELYKKLWPCISPTYLLMFNDSIVRGALPKGVTEGLIVLLHKGGPCISLNNWHPITLLNISYKFFAKALQIRLQPVLMEVISPDQSAFLPMRFILDNIYLTHETIAYAKQTHQPLLFLKLDFSKAYDKVDLVFLFSALTRLGFPTSFVRMVRLLFQDAVARVNVNGKATKAFPIQQGVQQVRGRICGINLLGATEQQTIAQYADDTSLSIRGEEASVKATMDTLQNFSGASGLVINEYKSLAYYWHPTLQGRPA